MWPILVGIETEYGFSVEGHGAENQIDDAIALVRGSPDGRFVGWDYRFEAPRSDLRGFQVSALAYDPEDAKHDTGRAKQADKDVRSDRILSNGARFYNDHGHPEIATPECWSLEELALQDKAGESVVLRAAEAFSNSCGLQVKAYKNNTDGHGSSYGTHESYLVPRKIGFDRLFSSLMPILVSRQVVCGAGKVGAETGMAAEFQISQRADFMNERASVDTLYRRPIFNTRDEPHADPSEWARLHVICGDANRILEATSRKVALIKLALWLEGIGQSPLWRLSDPVRAFSAVSRDLTCEGRIELEGGSWTNPGSVLESYVEAGERHLDTRNPMVCEALAFGRESLELLEDWRRGGETMSKKVDWAAKHKMLQGFVESEDTDWSDPVLRAYDLAYHDLDPEESLFSALQDLEYVDPDPSSETLASRLHCPTEGTRARARSVAVRKFSDKLVGVSWGCLEFETDQGRKTVALSPDMIYPESLETLGSVESFLEILETQK